MWSQIYSTAWTNLVSMIPLLCLSIFTIAIIIERLLHFRPRSMFDESVVNTVVEKVSAGQTDEALDAVRGKKNLLCILLHDGLVDRYQNKVMPEVAFLDHGMSKLDILARWVPTLNFIAKVAPLLGLLGTVLGMIDAFEFISASAGDAGEVKPEEVAKGIGTALLTTASGLLVAIPAMVAASVLTRAGEKVYNQFEEAFRRVTIASGGLRIDDGIRHGSVVENTKKASEKGQEKPATDNKASEKVITKEAGNA